MAVAYDSRDMVEDFLRLRLQQDGLDWRAVLPLRRHHTAATSTLTSGWRSAEANSQPDPTLAPPQLQVILRSACSDMERRYRGDLIAHLSVLSRLDAEGLTTVREELFRDGVNWGRIVAMMEVGGAMCTEVVKTGGPWQVEDITDWMTDGLDSLQGWIEDNGGWDAFVELYGEPRPPVSLWSLRTLFGLAVLGAAGITLAAMFIQR